MGSLNWASGLISLGRLHLRPLQRHFLTHRFTPLRRSDPLVLANLLGYLLDLSFLISGTPIRPFQAEFIIFKDASTQGCGTHMGDSQISGTWICSNCKLHINCLELRSALIAVDDTTVVSYIKQGGTYPLNPVTLVVDLFLWLQTQHIAIRARHISGCLNVLADRLSRPNQPTGRGAL